MKPGITNSMPTPELLKGVVPASGTGNYRSVMVARVPFNATSTANGATNWINPETGTIAAKVLLIFTTAGTGTVDVGISDDGTGAAADLIDGGTLTVGAHYVQEILGTVAASATVGGEDKLYVLLGPGGTGTNNSIVATHTDTTTSTSVGAMLVEYFLVGG